MNVLKKICGFISGIIIVCLVLIAVILYLPFILGGKSMAVLSGSMEPAISVGSIVSTQKVDFGELKVDDVITYEVSPGVMVTHRIFSIDSSKKEVVTKGDANNTADGAPVLEEQIVGKVIYHVPYIGYISIYLKTPKGILVACIVIAALIIFNFLPEIFKKEEKIIE